MFYGCDFTFDGKKASDFGLTLYNVGSYGQDDVDFSVGEIVEDRISRRYDSLLYGLVQNEPLQFTLVFGMDPDNLAGEACLTRAQIADITKWLTGHQTYKILKIDQDDMKDYFYRAMVTGLKLISDGGLPTAFSAEITCDSPFAYTDPSKTQYWDFVEPEREIVIQNPCLVLPYYYPKVRVILDSNTSCIEFTNLSDGGRTMRLDNIPLEGNQAIVIDCKNQIISSESGYNLYPGFNMRFLRLVPGENIIDIRTNGNMAYFRIYCEFPVNIGA